MWVKDDMDYVVEAKRETGPSTSSQKVLSRPVVIEVVGPAGVGKSILTDCLAKTSPDVEVLHRFRKRENTSLILKSALPLLKETAGHLCSPCWRCSQCLHALLFLHLMASRVEERTSRSRGLFVLDEGPVFMLSKLRVIGHADRCQARVEKAVDREYQRWAKQLDMVVVLDAPNDVLVERIRSRPKNHVMKNSETSAIVDFLNSWRTATARVSEDLSRRHGVKIVRYNTHEKDAASISLDMAELF